MKKFIYSLFALAAFAMTFTSCEDIPAPYNQPGIGGSGSDVYINQTFASTLNPWTSFVTAGADGLNWTNAYSSAVCTGSWQEEGATSRSNHAGTSWLVSPTVDLSQAQKIRVSFEQAIAYERTNDIALHHELFISNNYVAGQNPEEATWTKLDLDYGTENHSSGNYNFELTGLNLTPDQVSATTTFALRYTSTTANASTWEVKNFLVMEGEYSKDGGGGETSAYKQANGVVSGQQYIIVAKVDDKYLAAQNLTSGYGYLQVTEVELFDGEINAPAKHAFTVTQVTGGYTIQDEEGYYYYQTGTYNNWNRSQSVPESGHIWSFNFNDDGTVSIVNTSVNKTIQYDTQYGSYGSYAEVTRILPYLFTNGEVDGDKGEGGSGNTGGGEDQPTGGKGTTADNPYSIAEALEVINGLADGGTTASEVYVKGKTTAEGSTFYFNATYGQCNYYISADGSETNTIYVFNGVDLNNQKFTAAPSDWGKGTEVVIYGKLQKYVKDGTVTPEIARGNYPVSVTKATPGSTGGGESTSGNVSIEVSGTTLTFTATDLTAGNETVECVLNTYGWENNTVPPTVTLNDGTTIVFSKGSGSTDPKYYTATNGVRLYAKNDIKITGNKKIAKVVLEVDSYNGTDYVGNDTRTANVADKVFTIVNEHSSTSGGVQLRVKTITITYAN